MAFLDKSIAWAKRNATLLLAAAAALSVLYTYIAMTGSSAPLGIKPRRVWWLLAVNGGLLLLLVGVVGTRVFGLWRAVRSNLSGSRLQTRILLLFSLVAILPTIAVSAFSALFFNLGIQAWFNERVQTALGESLAVAEAYLTEHKENIRADALNMANDLNQSAYLALSNPAEFNRIVATQSVVRELTEAMVFQENRILAQGKLSFALSFERIPQEALERADSGSVVFLPADNDKVRALVKLEALHGAYLLVGRLIDSKVIAHMQNTQGAVSEYNALESQLAQLQTLFSLAFVTLALLLLLAAIGYGMAFAARLTTPISWLASAAERVRSGDFTARVLHTEQNDEIGVLARSFNRMTEQLEAQRGELIEANRRLDARRRFSEAVLSGVSAGVIALDRDKRVTLANRSSAAILNETIIVGANIADILPGIQESLSKAEDLPTEVAQDTLTVQKDAAALTLHVRIAVEKLGDEIEGFIVTFDDITQLVSAQRTAAWADVARRVAHEIKNPLTPIQLAAERLKRKYLKYVQEGEEQENFTKYTDTIAKQVGDIGRMVEEFVSFARMPTPVFADEDLVPIVKKAIFSAQVGYPAVDFHIAFPDTPVRLHCDERQITQVLTNVLKNAAESIEARMEQKPGDIGKGKIAVNLAAGDGQIVLSVEDNGVGFPLGDARKMLDPYVTTRAKGTGLGLAIVKKIMEDHKGRIALENNPSGGARVLLSFSATV